MINTTRENYAITNERGFDLLGVDQPNSRKATQMAPGDRLAFYVREDRSFVATATVTGRCFQEQTLIWKSSAKRERFRNRVRIEPDIIGDQDEWVDGLQVGPTLEYVKRWPPEMWDLAFFGMVHIISKRDFDFIEGELSRFLDESEVDETENEPYEPESELAETVSAGVAEPEGDQDSD